jgi:hypothetical protein
MFIKLIVLVTIVLLQLNSLLSFRSRSDSSSSGTKSQDKALFNTLQQFQRDSSYHSPVESFNKLKSNFKVFHRNSLFKKSIESSSKNSKQIKNSEKNLISVEAKKEYQTIRNRQAGSDRNNKVLLEGMIDSIITF